MRKKMAWFSVISIFIGFFLWFVGTHIGDALLERAELLSKHQAYVIEMEGEKRGIESMLNGIDSARTDEAWGAARKSIAPLPNSMRALLSHVIAGKEIEVRFHAQEQLLFRARALLEINENDFVAQRYIKEAEQLHKQNLESVSQIKEIKDNCAWNYALYYLKGVLYYRGLAFVDKNDRANAKNLVDQSLNNLVKALQCAPKDRDTEASIEVLYRKAKGAGLLAEGSGDLGSLRLGVLPSQESGPDGPGTGGRDREQGRH